MAGAGRRVAGGLLAWALTLGGLRALVVQPEQCRDVSIDQLEHAVDEAIAWSARTQDANGRFIYRYDAKHDRDLAVYEMVRHAGLTMSLFQAERDGFAGAADIATRGLAYAHGHLIDHDDWIALADAPDALVNTGASALLLAGLTYRREATRDTSQDALMVGLGRFLTAMVEPSGAVGAEWNPLTAAPVSHTYSPFFTGESFWALTRLHRAFPDQGWDVPALRIAHYLAVQRDDAEDRFPPTPDHWAAYGLGEIARWPGSPAAALDTELRTYARRLAELESMQVRYESQRTGKGWSRLTRGPQGLGAGVGTIVEALSMLERTPQLDTPRVRERMLCAASLLVHRQADAARAARYPNPPAVQGAWFHGDVTQIDDQQHAVAGLLNVLDNMRAPA